MRPDKDRYYLDIAKAVSQRSTCLRAKAGAVIVKDDSIVSTGYVGSPRGAPNCCDIGRCKRDVLNVKPGERYEFCESVHAEVNAVSNAARTGQSVNGGKLYLYFERLDGRKERHGGPCVMCGRILQNAGIGKNILVEEVL